MEVKKVEQTTCDQVKQIEIQMKFHKDEKNKLSQEIEDQKESLGLLHRKNHAEENKRHEHETYLTEEEYKKKLAIEYKN
jgi:hypothetical protein